jgi:plastocyanin
VRRLWPLLALAFAAGCLSAPDAPEDAAPTPGVEVLSPIDEDAAPMESTATPPAFETRILDDRFEHARLDAATGATIAWVNAGSMTHTLVFDDDAIPDSGPLAPGARYEVTFSEAGDHAYHCAMDASMSGIVVVR